MIFSPSTPARTIGSLLLGVGAWTLAEYVLHRFVMHELAGVGLPSREHLLHHADPEQNKGRPVLSWVGIILIGLVLLVPTISVLFGVGAGIAAWVGWLVGYGTYQQIHNRSHSHAPRNRYGRWVRRHHFHHHYGHPMANHGVTSPVWDMVFGTHEVADTIRVPRRHVMAWLVEGNGTMRAEYVGRYVIVGSVDAGGRQAGIDRARAFANLAPHVGPST